MLATKELDKLETELLELCEDNEVMASSIIDKFAHLTDKMTKFKATDSEDKVFYYNEKELIKMLNNQFELMHFEMVVEDET